MYYSWQCFCQKLTNIFAPDKAWGGLMGFPPHRLWSGFKLNHLLKNTGCSGAACHLLWTCTLARTPDVCYTRLRVQD